MGDSRFPKESGRKLDADAYDRRSSAAGTCSGSEVGCCSRDQVVVRWRRGSRASADGGNALLRGAGQPARVGVQRGWTVDRVKRRELVLSEGQLRRGKVVGELLRA